MVKVNKAYAKYFDVKPEELVGKKCYEVMHGTKEPIPECPYKKTIETKEMAKVEIFEGRYLELITSPIFDTQNEVIGCVHIARDITERKKQDEQLIINDRLASIGQLASGIAHELNNPLTSIIGFADLLLVKNVPEDIRDDLSIIHKEAIRTADIVRGLLTFARKQKTDKEAIDVNAILQDVLRLRSYEHKVSNIEVKMNFAATLPRIQANGAQLLQVFINLIVNAEQAMTGARGKGVLTVITEQNGSMVRISFVDDGPGIRPDSMRRLFTPFFTTKEPGKGTGLGLSISHSIITEHGGRIYAESEPDKGATFIVELPIRKLSE